ncbi:unnamed protein product [Leptidea sinapis]|uniref:Uncharacterized protein n=1 Tax=Leptidea sinapis TaxID=189913 RepID=A0A5E4QJ99_9NEOP|nr:unnamed protein product [Leptidea sinapis]
MKDFYGKREHSNELVIHVPHETHRRDVQRELFAAKAESGTVDRKLSSSSAGSMKNKWLKAFRSLKPPSAPPPHGGPDKSQR